MIPTGLYSNEDKEKRQHTAERKNIKELPHLEILLLLVIFIYDLFAAFSFPFVFQRKKKYPKKKNPPHICTRCLSVCFLCGE